MNTSLDELLRDSPIRAIMSAKAGEPLQIQARTKVGFMTLTARAESDIKSNEAVSVVSLNSGTEVDEFTGVSRVVQEIVVAPKNSNGWRES